MGERGHGKDCGHGGDGGEEVMVALCGMGEPPVSAGSQRKEGQCIFGLFLDYKFQFIYLIIRICLHTNMSSHSMYQAFHGYEKTNSDYIILW